jgi:sulfur carrier protein
LCFIGIKIYKIKIKSRRIFKMTITIAGEKKEYAEGTTIAQIIETEKVENPLYVTVSLNDDFVDKDTFDTTTVKEGDSIEFLYFMGGGSF